MVWKINSHSSQNQRSAFAQAMRVVPNSDPERFGTAIGGVRHCGSIDRSKWESALRDYIEPYSLDGSPKGARRRTYVAAGHRRIIAAMPVIDVQELWKSYRVYQKKEGLLASVGSLFRREYRDVHAVRGIDLHVERGELVAFLGPNGAGKTTTLKLLSGVIRPSRGTCTVLGFTPWRRDNAYRRRFALVMGQKNQLWWDLPAHESFRLHQHIYCIPADDFTRVRDELADMLGVGPLLGRPVRELSLGERMKMELIAALLHRPEVLFLDEPTIGLDVIAQHNIQQFLKHYQEERKITTILTSHYMKDVAALCRRAVIIANGSIHYDGSLGGIIGQFGRDKIVTLQLSEDSAFDQFDDLPNLIEVVPPKIKFRTARDQVARVLAGFLDKHSVHDVSVEDPPLEEVIAQAFSRAQSDRPASDEASETGNGSARAARSERRP
jgi:ABC-2 type transport system ATP-binding protein